MKLVKRRHHRITHVDALPAEGASLANVSDVVFWVAKNGPVRVRLRKRAHMRADPTTGRFEMRGTKGARFDMAVTGWDDKLQAFRVLMPFGVAWGQAGRCWMTVEQVRDILKDEANRAEGVRLRE